jgi:hypothetical protein
MGDESSAITPSTPPASSHVAESPIVSKSEWLIIQRDRVFAILKGDEGVPVAELLCAIESLGVGYDIVFGSGWAAPLATACKGDLSSHVGALRNALESYLNESQKGSTSEGRICTVEKLVEQQISLHGNSEGVRHAGSGNIVNHLLWIKRILAFIAHFLKLVAGVDTNAHKSEPYQAARAAYSEFFSPFHPTILQWMVPPLLGLVPSRKSMLAEMGVNAEHEAEQLALARRLSFEAMQPVADKMHAILSKHNCLFTDKAGAAF